MGADEYDWLCDCDIKALSTTLSDSVYIPKDAMLSQFKESHANLHIQQGTQCTQT